MVKSLTGPGVVPLKVKTDLLTPSGAMVVFSTESQYCGCI